MAMLNNQMVADFYFNGHRTSLFTMIYLLKMVISIDFP
jgi:hypothetical protein